MAAVVEYLLAEVLELAGNATLKEKRKLLNPTDIELAVRLDTELNTFFKNVIIVGAAKTPFIHPQLTQNRSAKKPNNKNKNKK